MAYLQQVANAITAPSTLVNLACTQMFCNHLLDHYSTTKGVSLSAIQSTLTAMVDLYATVHGFTKAELQAVQVSIGLTGQSLAYIDKAPSDADVDAAIASGASYKSPDVHRSGVPPDTTVVISPTIGE